MATASVMHTPSRMHPTTQQKTRELPGVYMPVRLHLMVLCGDRAFSYPGALIRLNPEQILPKRRLQNILSFHLMRKANRLEGFSPRGMDVDRNGVAWVALASGHLASFDCRKCKVRSGPTATGQHCPEGWTFYTRATSAIQRFKYFGQCRVQLLYMGRPVQHIGTWRKYAYQHR